MASRVRRDRVEATDRVVSCPARMMMMDELCHVIIDDGEGYPTLDYHVVTVQAGGGGRRRKSTGRPDMSASFIVDLCPTSDQID